MANRSNKSRLISKIIDSLTLKGVSSCQSQGDADYLISSIVLAHAENMTYHVVLVAKDTDILVMLLHSSKTENVFMQYDKDHIYNKYGHSIKIKMKRVVSHHILLIHAISGCDTVSAVYGVGKKKALAVLESGDWDVLDVFLKTNPNHDEVARAGEMFLIKLYGRKHTCKTLDKLRYVLYIQKMSKVSRKFQLQNLPPTSDAARFHSYRAYYAVQEWLGNAQDYVQQSCCTRNCFVNNIMWV